MAKRIEVDGGRRRDSELVAKVRFSNQDLPDQRFAAGHIAVWLQVPAAHYVPATGPDQPLNAGKQGRIVLLNPAIQDCFVMIKDEARKLTAKIGRDPEGRNRFRRSLLPLPLPNRIQMSITDQM